MRTGEQKPLTERERGVGGCHIVSALPLGTLGEDIPTWLSVLFRKGRGPKTMRYTEDNLFSFLWPLASYRAKVKLLSTKLRYNIQYFLSGTLCKKDFQLLIFISFFYYHLAADQAAIF